MGYRQKVARLGKVIDNENALKFLLAGKSEFTIESGNTGERFSFTLTKKESTSTYSNAADFVYFLNILIKDKPKYAGLIIYNKDTSLFEFRQGKSGKCTSKDIRVRSLLFILNKFGNEIYNIPVTIYHIGRCGRCGKKLTSPESILTGLGPECAKLCGIEMVKLRGK